MMMRGTLDPDSGGPSWQQKPTVPRRGESGKGGKRGTIATMSEVHAVSASALTDYVFFCLVWSDTYS